MNLDTEQRAILAKFTANDLHKARKSSAILISQTKLGLIELTYNANTKQYRVVSQDGGDFQKSGSAKEMSFILADLYTVHSQHVGCETALTSERLVHRDVTFSERSYDNEGLERENR